MNLNHSKPLSQKGFSVVEILAGLAIGTVLTLGAGSLIASTQKVATSSEIRFWMNQTLIETKRAIFSDVAWSQTIYHSSNNSLACLRLNASGERQLCAPTTNPTVIRVLAADGSTLIDSSNPRAGFSKNGAPCTDFDATLGSDQCPLRVEIGVRIICDSSKPETCYNPEPQIEIKTIYKPRDLSYIMRSGNSTELITRKLDFTQLEETCRNLMGASWDNGRCEFTVLHASCPAGQFLSGYSEAGELICQTFQTQDCPSGRILTGFEADGRPICETCRLQTN